MKTLKFISYLLALVIPLVLTSQSTLNVPKFFSFGNATRNEKGTAICVENDGSYYIGGSKNDSAMVMRLNNKDSVLWVKTYKFTTAECMVNYLGKTSDGFLIGSAGSLTSNYQGSYFKLDPVTGNFIWNKTLVSTSIYVNKVLEKSVNEYICVCAEYATASSGANAADAKLIYVSATSGNILSQTNCYGYQPYNWLDDVEGSVEIRNNVMYTTGRSYLQNAPAKMRANLMKYDSNGNLIWAKYLHKTAAQNGRMYPRDLIYYSDSKLLLTYMCDDNCTGSCIDFFPGLMLIDTSGTVIWDKTYNIPASNSETIDRVVIMGNSIYVTGFTNYNSTSIGDAMVLKTDLSGNLQACKSFGAPGGSEIAVLNHLLNATDTKNGLLYFTVPSLMSNGYYDISVLKLDSTLNVPCTGTVLATSTQTWAPYQISFPPELVPKITTISNNTTLNSTLSNTCILTSVRIVDTINVAGIDTVLNAFTPTATSYQWNTGATTYSIHVTSTQVDSVIISQNCCTSTKHVYYVRICSANFNLIGNTAICSGSSSTLTAVGAASYTWQPNASLSTTSGSVVVVNPTVTTTYSATATSSTGCISHAQITVSVNPMPLISITGNSVICQGATGTLTATGAQSYTWSPAISLQSVIGSSVSTTALSSPVTFTVNGTTALGCPGNASFFMDVIPSLTLSVSGNTVVCPGQTTTLTAGGASSYTWSTGATTASVSVTPTASTVYTVTGTTGFCTSQTTVSVTVDPGPSLTVAGNTTICPGQSTTLTASGATSYTWDTGSSSPTISVSPATTTSYTLSGTMASCSTQTVINVSVIPIPTIAVTGNTLICEGSSTTLTATGTAGYIWSTGATTQTLSLSPLVNSTYTVTGITGSCSNQTTVSISVIPLPAITVVGNTTVCAGQSSSLTVSGATSYTWNTGAQTSTIAVNPLTNTTYTVNGTVGACTSQTTVAVNAIPLPTITVTGNTTVCSGQSTTLTANGAQTYTWSNGVLTSGMVVNSPISTTYTVMGTSATCTSQAVSSITVVPTPTVSVSGNTLICSGQSTTLSATGAATYIWDNGAAGTDLVVSPLVNTTYTVTGITGSCLSQASIPVTVNPSPTISVTGNMLICPGQTATLTASGATTYTWNTGTVSSILTDSPLVTTNYSVTGSLGLCTGTATTAVTVATLSTSGNTVICTGESVTLSASGAVGYFWNTGATSASITVNPAATTIYSVTGSTGSCTIVSTLTVSVLPAPLVTVNNSSICPGQNTSLVAQGADTYTWSNGVQLNFITVAPVVTTNYTVTGSVGSCTDNAVATVSVLPGPTALYYVTPNPLTSVSPFAYFTNQSVNYTKWWWVFGDSSPFDTVTVDPSHYYNTDVAIDYPSSLTVMNSYGCMSTFSISIKVEPEFTFYIPNAFSPTNNDGINDVFTGYGVGIKEFNMMIFDRWGKCIYSTNDITNGWNGRVYNMLEIVPQDSYVWKVEIKDVFNRDHSYVGHVIVFK